MKLIYFLFIFCRSPLNRYYKQVIFFERATSVELAKTIESATTKTGYTLRVQTGPSRVSDDIPDPAAHKPDPTAHKRCSASPRSRTNRAVQDWYASHPREASEEAEHWTRLTAESAERRQERHEWREERREERRAGG